MKPALYNTLESRKSRALLVLQLRSRTETSVLCTLLGCSTILCDTCRHPGGNSKHYLFYTTIPEEGKVGYRHAIHYLFFFNLHPCNEPAFLGSLYAFCVCNALYNAKLLPSSAMQGNSPLPTIHIYTSTLTHVIYRSPLDNRLDGSGFLNISPLLIRWGLLKHATAR